MIERKKNNMVKYLNGYFKALNDISGGQNEFHSTAILVWSDDDIMNELKLFTNPKVKNIKIIKRKEYKDSFLSGSLIKKLILPKPFSGLYPPRDVHTIPSDNLKLYKDYCTDHISDYINFSFMEEGLDISDVYSNDIDLLLMQRDEEYCIVLLIKIGNIKLFLFFYRKLLSKDEFYELFDFLVEEKKVY